jgi:hypothetical protein
VTAEQRRRMKEPCRELWLEKLLPCWSMTVISHAKYLVADPLIRQCMAAQVRVSRWPAWKRNILTDSASPTVRVPRKPIVIVDGGGSDE